MSFTLEQMQLQARLSDVELQLATLQRLIQGQHKQGFTPSELEGLYWEACRRVKDLRPREVFLWCCMVRNLTVNQLLTMGRAVSDPFPWKPFLALLDRATVDGYLTDEATEYLLHIAQELLNAQGLWVLTPADLMGTPLAIQEAVAAL